MLARYRTVPDIRQHPDSTCEDWIIEEMACEEHEQAMSKIADAMMVECYAKANYDDAGVIFNRRLIRAL